MKMKKIFKSVAMIFIFVIVFQFLGCRDCNKSTNVRSDIACEEFCKDDLGYDYIASKNPNCTCIVDCSSDSSSNDSW
ncbi:MAG: hypothetical protein OEV44_14380 [Spirochaetota bacterium]|nr:hypothetical protein [Spirochaetota bacterium]